jgi:hypothetical protein
MRSALLLACAVTAAGCAHTSFYTDPDMTKKTGFLFYTPRPYLLVARTGDSDKPVEVSVVYLPDMEHPQFAVPHSGWGSSEMSITITNGVASMFGGNTDARGPETISALASLLGSGADLVKTAAELKAGEKTEIRQRTFELYEILQTGGQTTLRKIEIQ